MSWPPRVLVMAMATVAALFLTTAAHNWNYLAKLERSDLSEVRNEKGDKAANIESFGGKAMSIGLWNSYNLAIRSGKDKAAAEIFDKRLRHTWISVELSVALEDECCDEHPLTARSWPLRRAKRFWKVVQYSTRLDGCSVAFLHYWS